MALRSTDIMKIAGLAAAGCAVAPCGGFVPMLRTSSQSSSSTSHVAGRTAQQSGSAQAASWLPVAGLAGSAAVAQAAARRSRQSKIRVASSGAATIAPEEVPEEPEEPAWTPASEVGAMEPLGYFDPLGFVKEGDEEGFRTMRAAEIKHGRVAMMAAVGTVFQHFVRLPPFEKTPAGISALGDGAGISGFAALALISFALEYGPWYETGERYPGNFGDPFGLGMYTTEMRNREINNGRMAMISILGIIVAELVTGKDGVAQLGL